MLYTSNLPSWCSGMPTMSYVPESTSVFWDDPSWPVDSFWHETADFCPKLGWQYPFRRGRMSFPLNGLLFQGNSPLRDSQQCFLCKGLWTFLGIPWYSSISRPTSTSITPKYARNGKFDSIPVVQVVPGDILFMRGGDIVPADCYWLEGDPCQVDEADEWCSDVKICQLPSGKHTKNYGKLPFLMGKSTINGHFQ